ncbi:MAG TPA: sigma-70 family RNA polymerase sigma factor [Candidatus Polarisedimenticolaceae bacterium]|nr:sigma-70 family RNA polymerase sigma factor [Candidatus Polarisedimenticolaceae bacterium]
MEQDPAFHTTRWSRVLAARGVDEPEARRALAELCGAYWYPLYSFLRRRGHPAEEAADLTQGYFAELLEKRFLDDVHPERGKLRSFLLVSLKHYVSHERERQRSQKRSVRHRAISIDAAEAEQRYRFEPADPVTPETIYERRWALTVIERARARLADEMTAAGKREQYRALAELISFGRTQRSEREIGESIGLSEGAVGMALLRLRRRLGRLLREEIAHTVHDRSHVDEELHHLLTVLQEL